MTRVIVRARAERDIRIVFEWYESQQPGLSEEFLSRLGDSLEAVRVLPESAQTM